VSINIGKKNVIPEGTRITSLSTWDPTICFKYSHEYFRVILTFKYHCKSLM